MVKTLKLRQPWQRRLLFVTARPWFTSSTVWELYVLTIPSEPALFLDSATFHNVLTASGLSDYSGYVKSVILHFWYFHNIKETRIYSFSKYQHTMVNIKCFTWLKKNNHHFPSLKPAFFNAQSQGFVTCGMWNLSEGTRQANLLSNLHAYLPENRL